MYETILNNTKKYFNKAKRSNAELSEKMHQLFQDNIADYDKFNNWYGKDFAYVRVGGQEEFEHYLIENYKKSVYGESYEIKEYKPFYS